MSLSPKFPWHSSIFLDNVPNLEALSEEMAASLILHSFMGQEGWSPPSAYYHLCSDNFVSSGTTCVLTDTTSSPCLGVLERPHPQSWQCCRIPPLALPRGTDTWGRDLGSSRTASQPGKATLNDPVDTHTMPRKCQVSPVWILPHGTREHHHGPATLYWAGYHKR